MIEMQQMFGLPKEVEIVDLTMMDEILTISAVSTQMSPLCPLCGANASRVHSSYSCQIADVPFGTGRKKAFPKRNDGENDQVALIRMPPMFSCSLKMGARVPEWLADIQRDQRARIQ